jgi:cell division septation protein DedD
MNNRNTMLLLLLALGTASGFGQNAEVQKFLTMANSGQVEEVRREVPALLAKYPNDPGVLYLQALTTKDGAEAARVYQSVVDNFPKSAYADASLFKLYQFYYALGLYRTADLKLKQLQQEYPNSKYLTRAGVTDPGTLPEEVEVPADSSREAEAVPAPAQPAAVSVAQGQAAQPQAPASVTPTGFVLQTGAFSTQANAEKQKAFFVGLGYSVELITKVRDTKTLYVVLVGSFTSYDAAKAKAVEIKKQHKIDCMVVSR